MKILKQGNYPRTTIGTTKVTVADQGCLITCLSMLSDWYGKFKTPDWIAKNLSYTPAARLYWKSIDGKLPFDFVFRYYYRSDDKMKEILYSKDNACVIEVNSCHWVTLVGYSRLWGFRIADPLDGTIKYLNSAKFKNGTRYSISGFAEVTRNN